MFHFFFLLLPVDLPVGPMTSGRNIRGPSEVTHLAALAVLLAIRVPGRSSGNKQCSIGCKASMAVVLAGPLDMPTWSCNTGEHEYLHNRSLYWNEAARNLPHSSLIKLQAHQTSKEAFNRLHVSQIYPSLPNWYVLAVPYVPADQLLHGICIIPPYSA